MEFLVLGPLEVVDDGRPLPLGSTKQRLLLAALLAHANSVVSVDRLAEILWGDELPADATATLQTYVSRLRSLLGQARSGGDPATMLLTRAPGYLIRAEPDQVDAFRFEHLVTQGQEQAAAGEPSIAARLFAQALGLWRGRAYAEFADDDVARTESLRLEELRRVAVDERVEANLSLGRHAELIGELEGIVATEPLRERPRGQLMLALFRSGRQAEALRAFQEYRRFLGDELGVEPSTVLQRLEHDILRQSPQLDWVAPRAVAAVPPGIDPPQIDVAPLPTRDTSRDTTGPRAGDAATTIVGRSEELDQLRQWLADALGGSPRVVLLTGDAGIGKSRLVAELVAEARGAGMRPFTGRCLEGSRVPLLPVATVLDSLGTDVRAYGAIVGSSSADEHSVRLGAMVDASRALMATAADRPVLLVLEDAQWADPATIELIAHVSATVVHEAMFRQLPVMLLVTARPRGASPAAQRLLARLSQEDGGRTLQLGGLDELGVFALMTARTGVRPSTELLRMALDATGGNPLEVDMLVTRFERAGALQERGGELVPTVAEVTSLPGEVDAEVIDRLDTVSQATRHVLTTLALLRDGTIENLRIAAALDAEVFERSLDEAADAALLTDDGVNIEFKDGRIRRALERGVSGRRAQRMHTEIARSLVDARPQRRVAASEIAEQLHRAGPAADPVLLATYSRIAGDEALSLGAWADAMRHYDAALRAPSLDDSERAGLEQAAALAAYRSNDPRAATQHAERAVNLARATGDLRCWGEAALLRSRAAFVIGAAGAPGADPGRLEEFLDAVGADEPGLRARAHATLSEIASSRQRFDVARSHAEMAQQISSDVDDLSLSARVEFVVGLQRFGSLELDAAAAHFRTCVEQARRADDTLIEAWGLGREALVLWNRGELDRAAEVVSQSERHDRTHGWWGEYSLSAAVGIGVSVARGNLGAVERLANDAASAQRRGEQAGVASLLWSAIAGARTLLGDGLGAHQALDEWEREDARVVFRCRQLVDALVGGSPASRDRNDDGVFPLVGARTPTDLTGVSLAASDVELADTLGRPELSPNALELLARGYERGMWFTAGWCLFVPRLAGVACLLAGQHDEADEWLHRAMADARAAGAAGELARATYDLGRTRIAAGAVADATELLDAAIGGFERLGYLPLLSAARRLAGRPAADVDATPTTRVVLITDLVDSTPLNERIGDRRFLELLREHNRIVRARLRQFDGVEFKHTGDGIAAWFVTAGTAVQAALGIQTDLERFNASPGEQLHVRIGLSAGEVIGNEGDLFGLAVVEAFRVCDQAGDGRILVSEEIPRRVQGAPFGFRTVGEVVLKGFSDARTLYEVTAATA